MRSMSDETDETSEPITESRVREIVESVIEPFKSLLGGSDDEPGEEVDAPAEDESSLASMTTRQLEEFMGNAMSKKMEELEAKKRAAKANAKKRAPTPPTPKEDVTEVEEKITEETPGPVGGTLKSKIQKALWWVE